ncbi:MAG: outer membrane lipoprotein-sorting protein [Blastocatellia bacterium]
MPNFVRLLLVFAALVLTACHSSEPSSTVTPTTTPATAAVPAEDADKLLHQLATQDGCQDSTADLRLSFTDAGGKAQQMDFRLQRKYEGAKVSTMLTVQAPQEEREKALLAFEETGKATDVISYLAGLKKVAHLKSDNPLNFRGARNTVQEMLGMELGKYDIVSRRFVSAPGNDAPWIAELKAKSGMNLSYPKIEVVFASSQPQRFVLFDTRGEKARTIDVAEIKAVQNHQTLVRLDIEDHKQQQKLQLQTRSIKYDTNLPASLFTEANLIKIVSAASQQAIQ